MNDRLIQEFIAEAARAPQGKRMYKLIELVAERCATICEIDADNGDSGVITANTIRQAFTSFKPQLNEIAQAAAQATRH